MKRLILIIFALTALAASAQDGLNINALFDGRYRSSKNAVETIINGAQMRPYRIELYHSLALEGMPDEVPKIEQRVTKDGSKAISREVYYRDGHLYYGFYVLKPKNNLNRYIFYLNRSAGQYSGITLIYIEGTASPAQIKALIE